MSIRPLDPDEAPEIVALLSANGLPTVDLQAGHAQFVGVRDGAGLEGIVALESYGRAALLRSLAVRADRRRSGLGSALVQEAERLASNQGVEQLYLLTSDAEEFFARRGYSRQPREEAPPPVRATAQFTTLCLSSVCMTKRLLPAGGGPGR